MKQKLSFFFLLLLIFQFPANLPAAGRDSLYVQMNDKDKRVAIRALTALVSLHVDSLTERCMDYAKKAHHLAYELNDLKEIAAAEFSVAVCFEYLNQLDSSLFYYEKALKKFQTFDDKKGTVDCLNNMSILYKRQNNYAKALDLQLEGLPLRKQLGNQRELCQAYNNLGNLYLTIRDTAQAIDFYIKGEKIAEQSEDSVARIYLGLNVARMWADQKQYEKAKPILLQVLTLSQETHMIIGKISVLNLLAYIEQSCKNDEESFRLAQEALQVSGQYKYMQGLINSYDLLGEYYKRKKDYRQSLDHYLKALHICDEQNFKERRHEMHLRISEIYELLELPGQALYHYKEYAVLKDSIYNQENNQQFAFIQYKHELENNEKERILLEEKYNKQKQQQTFTFLLIILLLCIIIMLGILIYKHRQARKYLIELNEQKDRMFSLISHDLRGPIGNIKTIFDIILTENISHDEMKTIITESKEVIDNSYNLLENLLYWVRSQTGRIDVHPEHTFIGPIVSQCLNLFSPSVQKKSIQVINKVNKEHHVFADKEMTGAIIRNLLSNAVKFTYPNGEISISSQEKDGQIILTVSDSGMGMNKDIIRKILKNRITSSEKGTSNERGTGIGLRICHDFIQRNKGILTIESEVGKGSRFSVTLPAPPCNPRYKRKTRTLYLEQTGQQDPRPTVQQYF